MKHIYVDHAATTPILPAVREAMEPYMDEFFGNPSSVHAFGRRTKAAVDRARETMAKTLGCHKNELIFTSGGTEADNLAIFGAVMAKRDTGNHIITTEIEHHAVLKTCEQLEALGFEVTYLRVDKKGQISVKDLERALRDDTILVTMMYGNNEVGTLQPIEQVGQLLKEHSCLFHTDAVQALGVIPLHLNELCVDLLSLSSHKINGPKGVGCLYVAQDVHIEPTVFGGSQERKRRAGTENVPGIVGFSTAITYAYEQLEAKREQYETFRQIILSSLNEKGIAFEVNGHIKHYLPHILNISMAGVRADALLMNLDLEGIAASSGSACTAGTLQPSHVILAMYGDEERANCAVRFSFGYGNTEEEIQYVADKLCAIVQRIKGR